MTVLSDNLKYCPQNLGRSDMQKRTHSHHHACYFVHKHIFSTTFTLVMMVACSFKILVCVAEHYIRIQYLYLLKPRPRPTRSVSTLLMSSPLHSPRSRTFGGRVEMEGVWKRGRWAIRRKGRAQRTRKGRVIRPRRIRMIVARAGRIVLWSPRPSRSFGGGSVPDEDHGELSWAC